MKNLTIVANWKSYKSPQESKAWIEEFSKLATSSEINSNVEIILCAPLIDLSLIKEMLSTIPSKMPFFLGSQNLSPFEDGPYTGEISANILKDLVDYVMIGHSERRIHFKEDNEMVNKKTKIARKYGLKQIVCISEVSQVEIIKNAIPDFDQIILYEPLFAIGSGQTDSPENANKMARTIKKILINSKVIYGGSIKPENVSPFFSQPFLNGVAVGGASLNPKFFWEILKHAGAN